MAHKRTKTTPVPAAAASAAATGPSESNGPVTKLNEEYRDVGDAILSCSVLVTGARKGDLITAPVKDKTNEGDVTLLIHGGQISPSRVVWDIVDEMRKGQLTPSGKAILDRVGPGLSPQDIYERMRKRIAALYGQSPTAIDLSLVTMDKSASNHRHLSIIGQAPPCEHFGRQLKLSQCQHEPEATFIIQGADPLLTMAEEQGLEQREMLQDAINRQRPVTWKDIIGWIGEGHPYTLTRRKFIVRPGTTIVDRVPPGAFYIDATFNRPKSHSQIYLVPFGQQGNGHQQSFSMLQGAGVNNALTSATRRRGKPAPKRLKTAHGRGTEELRLGIVDRHGQRETVVVRGADTAAVIRARARECFKIPADQQRLMFAGAELPEDTALGSIDAPPVVNGSNIHVYPAKAYVECEVSGPPLSIDELVALAESKVLKGKAGEAKTARRWAERLTDSGLKSAIQKCIRFAPTRVEWSDGPEGARGPIDAEVFVVIFTVYLWHSSGSFNPSIQKHIRGLVAALKRLCIVNIEDSYGIPPSQMLELCGVALVANMTPAYVPSVAVLVQLLRATIVILRSDRIIHWRTEADMRGFRAGYDVSEFTTSPLALSDSEQATAIDVSMIIHDLKSFKGDLEMVRKVTRGRATLDVIHRARTSTRAPELTMGFEHMIDQHCYLGIGHLLPSGFDRSREETFAGRFTTLFECVTGQNPRWANTDDIERRPTVKMARNAQRAALRQLKYTAIRVLRPTGDRVHRIPVRPASGMLSAALGAGRQCIVTVQEDERKTQLRVILGIAVPADEKVMRPPTRDSRDLYDFSERVRQDAVATLRGQSQSRPLRGTCPVMGAVESEYEAALGDWVVWNANGVGPLGSKRYTMDSLVSGSDPLTIAGREFAPVRLAETPATASELLDSDTFLRECMNHRTDEGVFGEARNGRALLGRVFGLLTASVRQALLGALRSAYEYVRLPVPSLKGTQQADEDRAYPHDWTVYRMLLLVSRCFPGSLVSDVGERSKVPLLRVTNANLVRFVREFLDGSQARASAPSASLWHRLNGVDLQAILKENIKMMRPHQTEIFEAARQREANGAHGHFVIMPTGTGKSITAVTKVLDRILNDPRVGSHTESVLWTVPKGQKSKADRAGRDETDPCGIGPFDPYAYYDDTREMSAAEGKRYVEERLRYYDTTLKPRSERFCGGLHRGEREWMKQWSTGRSLVREIAIARGIPCSIMRIEGGKWTGYKPGHINILGQEDLSRLNQYEEAREQILDIANRSMIVFDEVDRLFNPSGRTSVAKSMAARCNGFIGMTATPASKDDKFLAEWLKLTENYPVNRSNYLVAAANMLQTTKQPEVNIVVEPVELTADDTVKRAVDQYMKDGKWDKCEEVARDRTDPELVQRAFRHAILDRYGRDIEGPVDGHAMVRRGGGTMLVAFNKAHLSRLIAMCRKECTRRKIPEAFVGDTSDVTRESCGIVVVILNKARGYNEAVRLGSIVRGVYPSSSNDRSQMEGRLRRITQRRKEIRHVIVFIANSLQKNLYRFQKEKDIYDAALTQKSLQEQPYAAFQKEQRQQNPALSEADIRKRWRELKKMM